MNEFFCCCLHFARRCLFICEIPGNKRMAKNQNKTRNKPAMKLATGVFVCVRARVSVPKRRPPITSAASLDAQQTLNKYFKRLKNNEMKDIANVDLFILLRERRRKTDKLMCGGLCDFCDEKRQRTNAKYSDNFQYTCKRWRYIYKYTQINRLLTWALCWAYRSSCLALLCVRPIVWPPHPDHLVWILHSLPPTQWNLHSTNQRAALAKIATIVFGPTLAIRGDVKLRSAIDMDLCMRVDVVSVVRSFRFGGEK